MNVDTPRGPQAAAGLRGSAALLLCAAFLAPNCRRAPSESSTAPINRPADSSARPDAAASAASAPSAAPRPDEPALGRLPSSSPLAKSAAPLASIIAKADPIGDPSWTTEQFSEDAGTKINKSLLPYLADPTAPVPEGLLAPDFKATALRPSLTTTFKDNAFEVLRPAHLSSEPTYTGIAGFRDAVAPLRAAFHPSPEPPNLPPLRGKAKVVRVEPARDGNPWSTLVYFEVSRGPVQQNAEWQCTWHRGSDDAPLLLHSITLLRFEEIRAASPDNQPARPPFADATQAVLAANDSWHQQLRFGANHWHGNLDVAFGIHQGNQGLAIADTNGDGLEDIYFCQPDGLPNRFFLQQPDGTLRDFSQESGLDFLDLSRSTLLIDLDNDGDADCVLAHRFSVTFLENDGNARFRLVHTIDTESRVSGLGAADFDHDGDLDVYVCGYSPISQTSPEDIFANPVPYEDAHNGAFNYLYRNEGRFQFHDATKETGLDVNNTRFSFCAAWEDFDNDGDQDLYVANDFGRNNLYQNDLVPSGKPAFRDVAADLGVEDIAASMSVDWADADNDGHMDIYIGNMWSSAGNRIAFQQQFKPGSTTEIRSQIQRHARGNTFFKNVPGQPFRDASESAGLTMGRWAWGSNFVDLNNDGWEDIYVANGFMSAPDTGDL